MKRKKIATKLLLFMTLVLGLSLLESCYPDDTLSATETDIVFTNYYDSVHDMFQNYALYYMPDTVYNIDTTKNAEPIKNQALILSDIARNMESRGYTRVTDENTTQTPELVIVPSGIISKNVSVYYWYPYPGYGWGWGYPGYGWGYPGYYPPVPYYSSYTTGTLRMEMFNPNDIRVVKGDTINPVYWTAGINGILSSNTTTRITSTIDQAFKQSPYLQSSAN
jgi:hypothetical protein